MLAHGVLDLISVRVCVYGTSSTHPSDPAQLTVRAFDYKTTSWSQCGSVSVGDVASVR